MLTPMVSPSSSDPEPPLDPEMERVAVKLRRLLMVSGLIMAAGLVAVFAAIFYRLSQSDAPPPAPPAAVASPVAGSLDGPVDLTVAIPPGATIENVTLEGARLLLTVRLQGDGYQILVVDLPSGRIEKRVNATP